MIKKHHLDLYTRPKFDDPSTRARNLAERVLRRGERGFQTTPRPIEQECLA